MNHDDRYQLERFAKTEEEFQAFYHAEIENQMEAFSEQAEKLAPLRKRAKWASIIAAALPFVLTLLPALSDIFIILEVMLAPVIVLGFIVMVVLTIIYRKEKAKLESELKEQVVRKIVHFLNSNYTYEPKSAVPKQEFLKAQLFSRDADEYRGDDLIKGYVEDAESGFKTDLMFSEVEATEVRRTTDSKGNTRTIRTKFFHGLMFVVDFHKDFGDTVTQVVPNRKTIFGNTKKAGGVSRVTGLNDIDIEHPEFNEHFLVRSNDEVMSRVILQMDFIQKLLELADESNMVKNNKPLVDNLYISFKDGKMYLLMNTDRSHLSIDNGRIDKDLITEFYRDINQSLELIDTLNLNLRIYDKQ